MTDKNKDQNNELKNYITPIELLEPDESQIIQIARAKDLNSPANTLNIFPLTPIAGFKLEDMYFDFDKWFLLSYAAVGLDAILKLYNLVTETLKKTKRYKTNHLPLISIFGHADPVGKDDYNKTLSEKRAKAVYGLLINDPDVWKEIYTTSSEIKYLQHMLDITETGTFDLTTTKRVQKYFNDLHLFCSNDPLSKNNFLGKGDYACQGCSEFNPVVILPRSKYNELNRKNDMSTMNFLNSPNRRVTGVLFLPDTLVNDNYWPCKKTPDINSCKKRFWNKGDNRRKITSKHKEFRKSKDTFACRFYQRLMQDLSCEYLISFKYLKYTRPKKMELEHAVLESLFVYEVKNDGKFSCFFYNDEDIKEWYSDRKKTFKSMYKTRILNPDFTLNFGTLERTYKMTFKEYKRELEAKIFAEMTGTLQRIDKKYYDVTCEIKEKATGDIIISGTYRFEDVFGSEVKANENGVAYYDDLIKRNKKRAKKFYDQLRGKFVNITLRVEHELYKKRKR